jgi:hypothetical protein
LFRLAGVLGIWIRIDERLKRKVRGTKSVLLHIKHCPLEEQFVMLRGTNFGVGPLDTRRHRHAQRRSQQGQRLQLSKHSLLHTTLSTKSQTHPSHWKTRWSSLAHFLSSRLAAAIQNSMSVIEMLQQLGDRLKNSGDDISLQN